jgi:copper transport protein
VRRRGSTGALVVGVLAGLWLLAGASEALAHAVLRGSDPADGASVGRAPRQVVLTFTERPEPGLSTVHVLDADGRQVEAGRAGPVPGQPFQLRVPLGELPNGTYTVTWRTVSRDDGHVTGGAIAFGVGVAAPGAGSAGASAGPATPAPTPLATAGRLTLYCGLALLLGAAATGLAVFGGRLPAGERALLGAGAGLAVAGLVARVLAERAAVGASLGDLLASSTGRNLAWIAAGVAAAAAAAAALAFGPAGDRRRLLLLGAAAGGAMLLEVMAGHAATPSPLRPLNLLAQWLHLLAVGVWAGGLVWLLAGLLGGDRPPRTEAVLRFSRLALPVVAVIAVTGAARAVDLSGGVRGLLDTGFGRILDLKALLFAGLLLLAAMNRYRIVPALAAGRARADDAGGGALQALRNSVGGEVALVACVLLASAVLTQLPPGKFGGVTPGRPAAPPSVEVKGSDFTTTVRLALTVSPGTAGPNAFTANVTDYDSGAAYPATRVKLRFTLRDRPEVGGSSLELARGADGLWRGRGSMLSIDGRWVIAALVEGPKTAVTVPLELQTRSAEPRLTVSKAPGQPDLYTITQPSGGTLQAYVDPGRPGRNTVHFTFFTAGGDEQTIDEAHARMTTPAGASQTIELLTLSAGHFAANVDLGPGRVTFAIDADVDHGGRAGGSFSQQIE